MVSGHRPPAGPTVARRAGGDRAKVIADQTFQVVDGEFQPDGASEAIFNECAN